MLEAQVQLSFMDPPQTKILSRGSPGLLLPDQPHLVEPIGAMRMQVEFYERLPKA